MIDVQNRCTVCGSANVTLSADADRQGDDETADLDHCQDCGQFTYHRIDDYPAASRPAIQAMRDALDWLPAQP